jgi:hypothetical protein
MLREPQRILEVECVAKQFLPVPERNLPGVVSAHVEQVEQIKPHRNPAEQVGRRAFNLDTLLKLREAGDPVFERDDFTVCDEGIRLLPIKRRRYFWVPLVQALSIARKESQFMAVAEGKASLSVQLRLKQPPLSRKALVRECR